MHVVYGGAQLFKADTVRKLGDIALKALDEHAPDAGALAECLGLPAGAFASTLRERVVAILKGRRAAVAF